ncbi:hypothetical protein [Woodsholea maritima]|uniref:hypothetical protein n=1 Tax=Woodsholea maritima TaxID=240237 RepID=UPI00036DF46B|nr:hypothetical protein [Woodsholea maritima]
MARTRRPWSRFETIGSIAAIVVGIAAICVSTYQAHIMRTEIRASIWPAIQVGGFISAHPQGTSIGMRVTNVGVGPAMVERVRVYVGDEFIASFNDLVKTAPEGGNHSFDTIRGRIMASGETATPFAFEYPGRSYDDLVETFQYYGDHMRFEVCYCSSLNECWVRDLDNHRPKPVKDCSAAPSSDL